MALIGYAHVSTDEQGCTPILEDKLPAFGITVGLVEQGTGDWCLAIGREEFVKARSAQAQFSARIAERNAGNSGHFIERADHRFAVTGDSRQSAEVVLVRAVPASAMTYPRLHQRLELPGPAVW